MPTRPIALLGSERLPVAVPRVADLTVTFDAQLGIWRNEHDRLPILGAAEGRGDVGGPAEAPSILATRITKTREGMDQTEHA